MITEIRPWGKYTILGSGDGYQIKLIVINPNSRLSLQRHKHRAERWYILEGTPIVNIKGREFPISAGSAVNIPAGGIHRIGATNETVKFIEIQTGDYFGEDDIERFEDDFGRIND